MICATLELQELARFNALFSEVFLTLLLLVLLFC